MKILLLNDTDNWAGTESHILDLTTALRAGNAEVTLACPPNSPLAARAAGTVSVIDLTIRGLFDWRAARALARLLSSGRADLIHAHNGRTQLHGALAITLARRGTLVWTQHFITPHHARGAGRKAQILRRVHRAVNARTDGFIAISEAVKAAMIERGEARPAQIQVVPNGIADPRAGHLEPAQRVRARHDIAPAAPLVVALSRLETEKDVETVLRAWPEVARCVPDARLLIGGRGAQLDALQTQIERANVGDSAQLIGFVEDALSLISAADVLVHAAPAEPFGLVFLEAMGLAKPVVACAGGAAPEIVNAGETGILVAPGDAAALGAALCQLLCDAPRARNMGKAGRARFAAHFTRAAMAARTLGVYEAARRL